MFSLLWTSSSEVERSIAVVEYISFPASCLFDVNNTFSVHCTDNQPHDFLAQLVEHRIPDPNVIDSCQVGVICDTFLVYHTASNLLTTLYQKHESVLVTSDVIICA